MSLHDWGAETFSWLTHLTLLSAFTAHQNTVTDLKLSNQIVYIF